MSDKLPPPLPPPPPAPELPEGWEELVDGDGRVYYGNRSEGKTQWSRPTSTTATLTTQRPVAPQQTKYVGSNGIDLVRGVVLERPNIIRRMMEAPRQFKVLGAPPAYGKTSLLQLVERDYKEREDYFVLRFGIDEREDSDRIYQQFLLRTGIDLGEGKIYDPAPEKKKLVLMDEAHQQYGVGKFWQRLIREMPTWDGSREFEFIFAVTYNLRIGGSPVAFEEPGVERIDANLLLLNTQDRLALFDSCADGLGYSSWRGYEQLRTTVIADSGGQVGTITCSSLFLEHTERTAKKTHRSDRLPEGELLRSLFSDTYLQLLNRCFCVEEIGADVELRTFLGDIYVSPDPMAFEFKENNTQRDYLRKLVKGGILTGVEHMEAGNYHFTTPMAKRLFYKTLFPRRAPTNENWGSISDLVIAAVKTMSATELQAAARASPGNFPKEASFQQYLMRGLAENLYSSHAVTPEMSRSWDGEETVKSELDFFVNGTLLWGIEVLKQGSGIGEHVSRFALGGKYDKLGIRDFLVVDFRPMRREQATRTRREAKRLTFFFSENYVKVEYKVGLAGQGSFDLGA